MTEILLIAGMSGAGRSTAADVLDDLGWFVIDNLPPSLMLRVAELAGQPGSPSSRVAFVIGREAEYLDEVLPALADLRRSHDRVRVLFLEAAPDVLVQRFEGTRRRHPLSDAGVLKSIAMEADALGGIKEQADLIVDTTELNVHELRARLLELFDSSASTASMRITVVSFGYKYGLPRDADLVFDCRFLPNPHWVPELRSLTGLDEPVRDYVLACPESLDLLVKLGDLLTCLFPSFEREGKSYLTIAIGCTGGQHRSVVLATELARILAEAGYQNQLHHRDTSRVQR